MDKTLRVWNIKSGKNISTLKGHTGGIECLYAHEKWVFSGSYDKTIRVYQYEVLFFIARHNNHILFREMNVLQSLKDILTVFIV